MGEGRNQQPPPPPSPSAPAPAPQAAVLSVMAEPYAPYYDHHHQQHYPQPHCHDLQINIPNAYAYGAPATPYPAPPRPAMMMMNAPVTTVHCPVDEEKLSVDGGDRLPCCGIGIGWFLFILGFFFVIPWYIGVCFLLCSKYDNREKPGYIACAVLAVIFLVLAVADATRPVYGQV